VGLGGVLEPWRLPRRSKQEQAGGSGLLGLLGLLLGADISAVGATASGSRHATLSPSPPWPSAPCEAEEQHRRQHRPVHGDGLGPVTKHPCEFC
jgi:hypothetical protein